MNTRVAEIEKLRLDNKLGKVIRLLMAENEYTSIDFSTLRGENGQTRTTPAEITKVLEKNFDSWFSVPSNLDPAALAIYRRGLGTLPGIGGPTAPHQRANR
jgi:hypothetical protein